MLSREELHLRGWRRNPATPEDAAWLCEAAGTPVSFPALLSDEVQWLEGRVDAAVREALEKIERRHAAGFKLLAAEVAFVASDSTLCLLMNDTFGYACADSEDTKPEEWELLWDLYQKFGFDGLIAWAAVRRGCDPIPPHITDQYREAAAAIRALMPEEPHADG